MACPYNPDCPLNEVIEARDFLRSLSAKQRDRYAQAVRELRRLFADEVARTAQD